MLQFAVVLFLLALAAAILGFGGITMGAATIAKILFIVFLLAAAVTFLKSPVVTFLMSLRERSRI